MALEGHGKLFKNGRNQAERVPREFELPGEDAIMRKEGERLIIEPSLQDHVDEWFCAAVEDGQFQVVQLDDGVVQPDTDASGEQMLGSGDEHAALLQAGGITDLGHIAAYGFDFKTIQVDTPEDDSRARWRGQNAYLDRSAAVQPDTLTLHAIADCLFEWQVIPSEQITPDVIFSSVVF